MAIKTKKIEKSDSFITSKQNAAERKREKANTIAAMFKGGNEPVINPFEYKITLIQALNWYNLNSDLKVIRGYLNEYLISTERKKLIPTFNQVSDYDIRSLGLLCRLKTRGQYLEEVDEKFIENRICGVLASITPVTGELGKLPTKVKVDKSYEISLQYCEAFEEAIDTFVKTKKVDFVPLEYLKANEVPPAVAKKIGDYYFTVLKEITEAQTDEDLAEGYDNFTTYQLKKFISFLVSIVTACNQLKVSAKISKPKKIKVVTPTKLVSKLNYSKDNTEFGLKSVKPESIVNSNEIWMFNVKYRKLIVYKAEKGGKLSVKGSTITGFDVATSVQTMVRKPEEFFKNTTLAKKSLADGFKDLKTKSVTPNGRCNIETIILGAW